MLFKWKPLVAVPLVALEALLYFVLPTTFVLYTANTLLAATFALFFFANNSKVTAHTRARMR
jgi:hypothetical protein